MIQYATAVGYLAPLLSRLAPIRTALSDLATEARRALDREGRVKELERQVEQAGEDYELWEVKFEAEHDELLMQMRETARLGAEWRKERARAEAAEKALAASVPFAEVLPVLRELRKLAGPYWSDWCPEPLRARVEAADKGEAPRTCTRPQADRTGLAIQRMLAEHRDDAPPADVCGNALPCAIHGEAE